MRIKILGDGGGIGDTLRRIGIVRAIKQAISDAVVWLVVPEELVDWALLDPVADQLVTAAVNGRRGMSSPPIPDWYQYVWVGHPFDVLIDLYDPAEMAENRIAGPVRYNRAEVWLQLAASLLNVPLQLQQCKLLPNEGAAATAASILHETIGKPRLVIGLQPLSHWRWRSLCFDQVHDMVKRLNRLGAQCILFHHIDQPIKQWAEQLGVTAITGEKPAVIVEAIRLCDGFVSCDSGLFHVAGALAVPTVGLFAQTDGTLISRSYASCRALTAGLRERKGRACTMPCYRRETHGCYRIICDSGCQALHRVSGKAAADLLLRLIVELQGKHLPPTTLKGRLFYNKYRSVSTP